MSSTRPMTADTGYALDRRVSVAPMMDWTDTHCRYFLRLLSPHVLLYTEMVSTGALIHGDPARHLRFDAAEHPVALQLGGSDPGELATCVRMGWEAGFDEINLNCGCPSDRVASGRFGACLMAEPGRVADCVAAMRATVPVPITVKTRLGIDERDSYEALHGFIETVAAAGCSVFILHARKAWLNGLSPKENREIPPLRYDVVHRIKRDFPALSIVINGGITDAASITAQLKVLDGVMIGRAAYHNPYLLAAIEREIFAAPHPPSRSSVLARYARYAELEAQRGVPLRHLIRHILGLYQGQPGSRRWRRHLSENCNVAGSATDLIEAAAGCLRSETDHTPDRTGRGDAGRPSSRPRDAGPGGE